MILHFAWSGRQRRRLKDARESLAREPGASLSLSPALLEALAADARLSPAAAKAVCARILEGPRAGRLRRDAESGRPWWRRAAALRILTRADHPDAVPLLERALFSGDRAVAGPAVALLGASGDPRAAGILSAGLARNAYTPSRIETALERAAPAVQRP